MNFVPSACIFVQMSYFRIMLRIRHLGLLLFFMAFALQAETKTNEDKWKKLLDRASTNPDSCMKAAQQWITTLKDDKAWASKAYMVLAKAQYYSSNSSGVLPSVQKALELQTGINDQQVLGMARYYEAMVYYDAKKYDEAIQAFEKAIPFLQESKEKWLEANAQFLLGYSYSTRKDVSGAREHYKSSARLFEYYVDTKVLGDVYAFWGDLEYYDARDYEAAAALYAQSAKTYNGAGLKKDGARVNVIAADTYRYLKKQQTALDLYFDALEYYDAEKNKKKIAEITKAIGDIYYESSGSNADAEKYLLESAALNHELGQFSAEGNCYIVLANMFYFSGNYPDAVMYFRKSLDCFEQAGSKEGMAGSYVGLANYYQSKGEFEKSLEMYQKSLDLYNADGGKNHTGISSALTGMGNCWYSRKNYDRALEYYLQSVEAEKKAGEDVVDQSVAFINIANIYINKEDKANAEKYLDLAIQEAQRTQNRHRLGSALKARGFYRNRTKQHEKAIDDCSEALRYAEEFSLLPESMECYSCLYYAYYNLGKTSEALDQYINYIAARDTIVNEKRNNEINKRELQYEYEKKETQLRMQEEKKQLALQEELKRKQLMFQFESRQAAMKAETEKKELAMAEELKRKRLTMEHEKAQAMEKIARDKKEMELNRDIEKREILNREQKRLNNWLMLGIGVFVVLTFIILKGYRDKKKANTIILQQKAETEKQKEIIELKSLQLEEKNREIVDSITYARRLQEAILPPQKLVKQYLNDSFILYKPRDIVAGDFYWMETIAATGGTESSKILFAVADCTGHGVPGAMVSVVCSGALNRAVKEFGLTSPGSILDKVRELVIETFEKSESEVKDGMDISLCSLDLKTNQMTWAGANNPLWVLRHQTQTIEEIKADKQPIGVSDQPKPFTTHTVQLQKGDVIYLSSDGYADQFGGEKGKKLKDANLKKLLLDIYQAPMHEQSKKLNEAFENWRGGLEQVDDVCVIGVRV